jgi:hypothetical protein
VNHTILLVDICHRCRLPSLLAAITAGCHHCWLLLLAIAQTVSKLHQFTIKFLPHSVGSNDVALKGKLEKNCCCRGEQYGA